MDSTKTYANPSLADLQYPSHSDFISKYERIREVGRGGMGVVFQARQTSLDRLVAVKVTLPGKSPDRFLREAKLLARIKSNHVVTVHDFMILPDGCPVLVMEWIEGADLGKLIYEQPHGLDEERVLIWMRQTCEGMARAADQGIIHRDLKPSNILVDQLQAARVADFGLACTGDGMFDLSQTGMVMGTPYYMAPEQAEDPRNIDSRADIYSFGATFYHALVGRPPFEGRSPFSILYKHKTEQVVPLTVHRPMLSKHTCELIERCLAKSPNDRFASFRELQDHLNSDAGYRSPWLVQHDSALEPFLARLEERKSYYLQCTSPTDVVLDVFRFPRGQSLTIIAGDLAKQEAQALVSSDTFVLSMSDGVSYALSQAAGPSIIGESAQHIFARPGRVVVTSPGRLKARFIFHGITAGLHDGQIVLASPDVIQEILASCFYHCDTYGLKSIAFPLLATGGQGFSRSFCLEIMFQYLARMFLRGLTSVEDARIVIYPLSRITS